MPLNIRGQRVATNKATNKKMKAKKRAKRKTKQKDPDNYSYKQGMS